MYICVYVYVYMCIYVCMYVIKQVKITSKSLVCWVNGAKNGVKYIIYYHFYDFIKISYVKVLFVGVFGAKNGVKYIIYYHFLTFIHNYFFVQRSVKVSNSFEVSSRVTLSNCFVSLKNCATISTTINTIIHSILSIFFFIEYV